MHNNLKNNRLSSSIKKFWRKGAFGIINVTDNVNITDNNRIPLMLNGEIMTTLNEFPSTSERLAVIETKLQFVATKEDVANTNTKIMQASNSLMRWVVGIGVGTCAVILAPLIYLILNT